MSCSKSAAGAVSDGRGTGTSIASVVEAATGSHLIKVERFSKVERLFSCGMGISYGKFSVGGHDWSIRLHPNGFSSSSADWVSCGIYLNSPAADVSVKAGFRLAILDEDGEPVLLSTTGSFVSTYTSTDSWSLTQFVKKKDLESTYLKNDSFCIRCDVTVIVEETCEECTVPQSDLNQHLGDLLDSEVGGDVTFHVGSEAFVAHKYVLAARSSVFKAQFFGGPMKEKAADAHVRVAGIEARVFKAMLHFIYTDSLPDFDKGDKIVMGQHLLVAADRYNIVRLKVICESMLITFMNTNLVVTTLVLAEQHGFNRLKEVCFKFLKCADNFKAVGGDDYKHLMRSCPSLLYELLAAHGLSSLPCEANKKP